MVVPPLPDLTTLSHAQKNALIVSLWEQVMSLTAPLTALEQRLEPPKTPDNSSVPPSKGQKPSLPSVPQRKGKLHPGAHRLLHPNPTHHQDVLAMSCQACGADVSGTEQSPCEVYDRVEIPTIEPDVTRVSLHTGALAQLFAAPDSVAQLRAMAEAHHRSALAYLFARGALQAPAETGAR